MDYKTLISNLIDSAAWPFVFLLSVYWLKDKIGDLIPRINRIKHKDTEVDFSSEEKASESIETESTTNLAELEEVKDKLVSSEELRKQERQDLTNKVIQLTRRATELDVQRNELEKKVWSVSEPYQMFFEHYDGKLSEGRRFIVQSVIQNLMNIDTVISNPANSIIKEFNQFTPGIRANQYLDKGLNGGALTGLRSAGIIDDIDQLTVLGVSIFKSVAKDMKH
jgi:hypothetical protein